MVVQARWNVRRMIYWVLTPVLLLVVRIDLLAITVTGQIRSSSSRGAESHWDVTASFEASIGAQGW
jgi:hypothetical protein